MSKTFRNDDDWGRAQRKNKRLNKPAKWFKKQQKRSKRHKDWSETYE